MDLAVGLVCFWLQLQNLFGNATPFLRILHFLMVIKVFINPSKTKDQFFIANGSTFISYKKKIFWADIFYKVL